VRSFDFLRASSLEEALCLLAEWGSACRVVAGGTDLLVDLRSDEGRWPQLKVVVDISGLAELKGVRAEGDRIRVGALVTHAQVADHSLLKEEVTFLSQACRTVGSPQIRNRGTIGGNVVNASPAADSLPPLVALGAEAVVASLRGERTVPLEEFLVAPYRCALAEDELLLAVQFPRPPRGSRSCFLKVGRRRALAIARLSLAVLVTVGDEGQVEDVRLVPGAAFPMPRRARKGEDLLRGARPSPELLARVGEAVAEEMVERSGLRWSTEYKRPVLAGLTRRALAQLLGGEN